MIHLLQNVAYYLSFEVLEPNHNDFEARIAEVCSVVCDSCQSFGVIHVVAVVAVPLLFAHKIVVFLLSSVRTVQRILCASTGCVVSV